MATITIPASNSAYVDSETPNTRYQGTELITQSNFGERKYPIITFNGAAAIQGKIPKSLSFEMYVNSMTKPGSSSSHGIYVMSKPIPALSVITFSDVEHSRVYSGEALFLERDYPGFLGKYSKFSMTKNYTVLQSLKYALENGVSLYADSFTVFSIGSHSSANPPRLVIETVDATPYIVTGYPKHCLIDKTEGQILSWTLAHREDDVFGTFVQKSAKVRYRPRGSTAHTEITVNDGTQTCRILANTFVTDEYGYVEWQVQATDINDITCDWSPWYWLETKDWICNAEIVAPKSTFIVGNEPNVFSWRHVTSTGTLQTAAELQTSVDGSEWAALATVTGGVQQTTIAANTLSGDVRFWRVRTANRDGQYGRWSATASIVVHAAPNPPVQELPEPAPRITLRWQSSEQQAYEVRAGDWYSGAIYGTTKVYTLPAWFDDGPVIVGVRVQSSRGLWSEWSTITVKVANQPQAKVELSAREVPHGVVLSWTGEHDAYTVYRDGLAIGSTTARSYTDWLAAGKHRYTVRGINGRFYAMSNTVTEYSKSPCGAISMLPNINWLPLRYRRGAAPSRAGSVSTPVTLQYYRGRSKPVAEIADRLEAQHTVSYSLQQEELAQLRAMVGKTVIYKGLQSAIVGVLLSVEEDSEDWSGIDVTLTIVETDYKEV